MEQTFSDAELMPSIDTAPGEVNDEEPQGLLERAIAQLWRETFRLDKLGRNDNFFELGGNSLLGMDLSEMIMARLGLQVPVLTIFQYPTIREIADFIATSD